MRRILSTLLLTSTLASSFSDAQGTRQLSAFDRYLRGVRSGRSEAALVRVAAFCGIHLNAATIRYAERPGEAWKLVKTLARARDDQETDFFATAEVWHSGRVVLVEEWSMDSEAGDEIRTLYCLFARRVKYGEQIEWSSPPKDEEAGGSNAAGWAYEVRWKVEQDKIFNSVLERFVDEQERPVPRPKLGPDAPTVFGLIPEMKIWDDLKLPDAMLQ